jgi:hypothetical protein
MPRSCIGKEMGRLRVMPILPWYLVPWFLHPYHQQVYLYWQRSPRRGRVAAAVVVAVAAVVVVARAVAAVVVVVGGVGLVVVVARAVVVVVARAVPQLICWVRVRVRRVRRELATTQTHASSQLPPLLTWAVHPGVHKHVHPAVVLNMPPGPLPIGTVMKTDTGTLVAASRPQLPITVTTKMLRKAMLVPMSLSPPRPPGLLNPYQHAGSTSTS